MFYPLPLHDALPILRVSAAIVATAQGAASGASSIVTGPRVVSSFHRTDRPITAATSTGGASAAGTVRSRDTRSEEHTSELQSLRHLVCRLLLEKKK